MPPGMTFRPSPPTRCSTCHRPLPETMEDALREASCPYGHESWVRTPFGLWIEAPPRPMALMRARPQFAVPQQG